MVKIDFYDRPKLVGIAKPGLIIEAESISKVASKYSGMPWFNLSPTGAYGYIMGPLKERSLIEDDPDFDRVEVLNSPGTILVHRLSTLQDISEDEKISRLISWFAVTRKHSLANSLYNENEETIKKYQGPVMALGEIVSNSETGKNSSELSNKLTKDSIYLTELDQQSLQQELLDYHFYRRKNDFYVKLPNGETIPIEDLDIIPRQKS